MLRQRALEGREMTSHHPASHRVCIKQRLQVRAQQTQCFGVLVDAFLNGRVGLIGHEHDVQVLAFTLQRDAAAEQSPEEKKRRSDGAKDAAASGFGGLF